MVLLGNKAKLYKKIQSILFLELYIHTNRREEEEEDLDF